MAAAPSTRGTGSPSTASRCAPSADADLVLGVGTRFMTTFGRPIDVGRAALVLLNADPADLGEPRAAELAIHADAGLGLRALAAAVGSPRRSSRESEFEQVRKWLEDCLADIAPQCEYLAAIRAALPDDGIFVSDLTQVGYAASVASRSTTRAPTSAPAIRGRSATAIATALGAKVADPTRRSCRSPATAASCTTCRSCRPRRNTASMWSRRLRRRRLRQCAAHAEEPITGAR